MKIENTSRSPQEQWLFGGNPSAIINQEKQGQNQLIESSQLPATAKYEDAKKIYSKLGIEVLGKSENDDIFYDVKLPKGWKKEVTDHNMWSKLINDKNEEIGMIFYKAAFYDRNTDFKLTMKKII